jgi:hypothetical protein
MLSRTLADIAALRRAALDLPLRAPVAGSRVSSRFGYRKIRSWGARRFIPGSTSRRDRAPRFMRPGLEPWYRQDGAAATASWSKFVIRTG